MMDTTNKYMVSALGDRLLILNPPKNTISKDDALLLAAWLVVLADPAEEEFEAVLFAVQGA